ncbi:hypothetical protein AVEN_197584-2-1, partial [Araneus ventricosus]
NFHSSLGLVEILFFPENPETLRHTRPQRHRRLPTAVSRIQGTISYSSHSGSQKKRKLTTTHFTQIEPPRELSVPLQTTPGHIHK